MQENDPVHAAKWSDEQHVPIISAYCTPHSDGHIEGETSPSPPPWWWWWW